MKCDHDFARRNACVACYKAQKRALDALVKACKEAIEDYLHLAQDLDGKVDSTRRKRYNAMKEAIATATEAKKKD